MTSTVPVHAQAPGTAPDESAEVAVPDAMREALERDLGLAGAELDELLVDSAKATELDAQLQEELAAEFAGSWFDRQTGALTVAVTDAAAAELAIAAGAETTQVSRSAQELALITEEVAVLVETDHAAQTGVLSWGVDLPENQVVVTVRAGQAEVIESLVDEYGDALAVEESAVAPQLAQDPPFLDGGIRYDNGGGSCSTGFNVRNTTTGIGYVLTAGHCGNVGNQTSHAGNAIGPFRAATFPGRDDALIEVTNTAFWIQGPWVFTYPGFANVAGTSDAPVGTMVCKSGYRTGWTCGAITGKDESVNYFDAAGNFIGTVAGLTRHSACVEQGDSGGSNMNVSGAAEGVTSGAQLFNVGGVLRCGASANPPQPTVSWYYPVVDSLAVFGPSHGVTLW